VNIEHDTVTKGNEHSRNKFNKDIADAHQSVSKNVAHKYKVEKKYSCRTYLFQIKKIYLC